jgi:hypothetical protein
MCEIEAEVTRIYAGPVALMAMVPGASALKGMADRIRRSYQSGSMVQYSPGAGKDRCLGIAAAAMPCLFSRTATVLH